MRPHIYTAQDSVFSLFVWLLHKNSEKYIEIRNYENSDRNKIKKLQKINALKVILLDNRTADKTKHKTNKTKSIFCWKPRLLTKTEHILCQNIFEFCIHFLFPMEIHKCFFAVRIVSKVFLQHLKWLSLWLCFSDESLV